MKGSAGNDNEWNGAVCVCVCVCVRVRVRALVHWYLRLCVCVLVLVDVVCSPNARPSPNSWQPRGCGAVAPVVAPVVAVLWLLSLLVLFCCCHVFARSVAPVAAGALLLLPWLFSRWLFALDAAVLLLLLLPLLFCHWLFARFLWLLLLPWLFSRWLFCSFCGSCC